MFPLYILTTRYGIISLSDNLKAKRKYKAHESYKQIPVDKLFICLHYLLLFLMTQSVLIRALRKF